ncbi:GntR family transcriptional regulator [Fervidibacillus halotolerans]|uniref:GntR family transcriptional regulator n=1 Tax=Fervidibacillus halotolerans TaxID=2980027 RepID=A0A9E8LYV2_9BACI|nr:GntR family transcriptional regulator [Fervidibacillus halotolerans]WAA12237.1 GntR family transcriptional regulator [Fervidibacillus halotolerans]
MILTIDFQSDFPIYKQIKHQIIEGIAKGELKPGDPLPSVRMLAQDLGVNMHTINKAYQLLKQEGFIQIHRQRGVVIQSEGFPTLTEEYLKNLEEHLRPLIGESICRGMKEDAFINLCQTIFKQMEKGGK